MFFIDPLYLLFALPGFLLALSASVYTKSTFSKYSKVSPSTGLSGAAAARRMLQAVGLYDVKVEEVSGNLTDHYDPRDKTLRLSQSVYNKENLSAIGVACHEAGHAIQHAKAYAPLKLRTALAPATNFCSSLAYIMIMAGFLISQELILLGALLFTVAVIFSIITLPVEWDASSRAKERMVDVGIVTPQEADKAGSVLNAAFLTYVAAVINALLILLYFLLRAGVLGDD